MHAVITIPVNSCGVYVHFLTREPTNQPTFVILLINNASP